jgi:heme/copper-type cytochrome/quinol oxidase subunit 3
VSRRPDSDLGKYAMGILILSLSILFAASMVAYLVVRSRAGAGWRPVGMPHLPAGLWISTGIIIALSVAIESGLRDIRRGERERLERAVGIAFLLGLAFLINQGLNWRVLVAAKGSLYGFTFFMLTGLHAAHVIGGLIPLGVVASRAREGRYTRAFHPGVTYCTMYWHFLAVVWIVMFTVLSVG